jgi:hypothetical protein
VQARLLAALVAIAAVTGCGNGTNQHRLHVMQADPVLRCSVTGVTPWLTLDSAGTTHGIGFGGTSPTTVSRILHLSASPAVVLRSYLQCALAAGWSASLQFGAVNGTKTFERQWEASLFVGAGEHDFRGGPAVVITIDTEPK